MKGLVTLAEKAIALGRRTVRAEKRAKERAAQVEPFLQGLFVKVANASGGLRGQKDVENGRYVKLNGASVSIENGRVLGLDERNVGRVFRGIKGILLHHVRALENDLKTAETRTEEAEDAYYVTRAIHAVLDSHVPARRKEDIVVRAFKDTNFRDAMDAVKDADDDAVEKFVRDQAASK